MPASALHQSCRSSGSVPQGVRQGTMRKQGGPPQGLPAFPAHHRERILSGRSAECSCGRRVVAAGAAAPAREVIDARVEDVTAPSAQAPATPAPYSTWPRGAVYTGLPEGREVPHGLDPSGHHRPAAVTVPLDAKAAEETARRAEELLTKRLARKQARLQEQASYQASAIAATSLIGFVAVGATIYRFFWHAQEFDPVELASTLLLIAGGAVGMEMYARIAHKGFWHEGFGWALHESHHEPRTGPFELNDIYAIINAVPAMGLCAYGFLTPGELGGCAFGLGLGITVFGMAYMFVHDGLVHKRFPVGPIAQNPYLRRCAVAHRLHHSEKYEGAPWGMFLGPQELEAYPGAIDELDRMVAEMDL